MNIYEYANILLNGSSLEDKLLPAHDISFEGSSTSFKVKSVPGRSDKLALSTKQIKFPKISTFHLEDRRGLALHFFANHELLAIEMMAAAILKLSVADSKENQLIQKGLLKTIADEQKHLKLYLNRMKEFKVEFGDYPLNDFFWRQMGDIEDYGTFFSTMALTFEQANLDFAEFYAKVFDEVGDEKSSRIMNIVLEDEISHVAFGRIWSNLWRKDQSLWDYYKTHLPGNLTPARAKGIILNVEARKLAGLDEDFIAQIEGYRDDYTLTNRKSWDKD